MRKQVKRDLLMLLMVFAFAAMIPLEVGASSDVNNPVEITIGNKQIGQISEVEQVNYYKLELPSAGNMKLSGEATFSNLSVAVYDSNEKVMYTGSFYWNFSIGKADLNLSCELAQGTYYIKFVGSSSIGSQTSQYFGDYEFTPILTSAGVNHSEFNTAFETSATIPLNSMTKAHIAKNNNEDYFKLTLPSGGNLKLSGEAAISNLGVAVYDSNQKVLYTGSGSWNFGIGKAEINLSYELAKGDYYIKFEGGGSISSVGNYEFTPIFTSAVNHSEFNTTFETSAIIPLNSMTKAHIAKNKNEDYFKITLPSGGNLTLSGEAAISGLGVIVCDSDQKVIYTGSGIWNFGTGKAEINLSYELAKGDYYVKFEGGGAISAVGSYEFTPVFTPAGVNHKEPNNSIKDSAAIPLGDKTYGHIAKNKQLDFYSITLPSAGNLKISTEFFFEYIGIQVFDSKQKLLYAKSFAWTAGLKKGNADFTLDLGKGIYYIKFVGNSGSADVTSQYLGNYNLLPTFKKYKKPSKIKLSSVKNTKPLSILVKWKAIKGVGGYQITYSDKKTFKGKRSILIKNPKSTRSFIRKLKSKKTYYVKVRAYKKYGDKVDYGGYSIVRKVKVKK